MSLEIKICGLTRRQDAELAIAAGADMLGFIFVPGSKRALSTEQAPWIRELRGAATVGVFMDAPLPQVLQVREALGLDWVQLHGSEPDTYLKELGSQVLRRVPVDNRGNSIGIDWERVAWLGARCLPLIDPGAGDGVICDWQLLAERPPGLRFGLAGGLAPDNVASAIALTRPCLVDVSSGVEVSPGIKDPGLIESFISTAHTAIPTG